ncbi:hypothetical protein DPEC_G00207850 [Dallia pectoralis]|uniref:Uncharacterized protein n=1 Tax=Dallia pectoralis TaxID=75939 RepID=A0ACC2G4S9_DALPE|nr:hypothetical protein DPEC_G00207850 [Dallia pectoralis]
MDRVEAKSLTIENRITPGRSWFKASTDANLQSYENQVRSKEDKQLVRHSAKVSCFSHKAISACRANLDLERAAGKCRVLPL